MSWITRRSERLVHKVIGSNLLIADGEDVVVGVSGGADNLRALHVLEALDRKHRRGWKLQAVHVDPGFEGWKSARVVKACETVGVPCSLVRTDVPGRLEQTGRDSCHTCAQERRRAMFTFCNKVRARKLVLAHNMDDVNETFLMNLLYTASACTILPVQPLFGGRLTIVWPLYYVNKELVRRYLRTVHIQQVRNPCPFAHSSSRSTIRRFLNRFYARDPRIRTNLFVGLHNLKPEYLPTPKSPIRGPL